jgi:hypothetical protein
MFSVRRWRERYRGVDNSEGVKGAPDEHHAWWIRKSESPGSLPVGWWWAVMMKGEDKAWSSMTRHPESDSESESEMLCNGITSLLKASRHVRHYYIRSEAFEENHRAPNSCGMLEAPWNDPWKWMCGMDVR